MAILTVQQSFELGLQHHRAGRLPDAEQLYRQVLARDPHHAGALEFLGIIAHQAGQHNAAAALIRQAAAITPNNPETHYNLAKVLKARGELDQAIEAYRRAVAIHPGYTEAYNNLGNCLKDSGRLDEAIAAFGKAIALQPNVPESHYNLANVRKDAGQVDEAIAAYRRAIALRPNYPGAHYNLALALLLSGQLAEGWREYEWRWQIPGFPSPRRGFAQPMWDGGQLAGRTILLHTEQGLGDSIQFSRYLPLVAGRGGRVVVEAEPELIRLFQQYPGIARWIPTGQPLPEFDVHCPLPSLPLVLGTTTLDRIPSHGPLRPDPQLVATWRPRLGRPAPGLKVALAWAGNPTFREDRTRSLSLEQLAPLSQVRGVTFFSIQKGAAAAQADRPPDGLRLVNLGPELQDFADTAAVMNLCDLVISTDTSVAHLAGALGRPVWVMLQYLADWRWLRGRSDSPWYPTMRLFRQGAPGDWPGVISQVVQAVAKENFPVADRE